MKLEEIIDILGANVLEKTPCLQARIDSVYASDLMSDVLAYAPSRALLLTGLVNSQVVRTAEMAEISAICFVSGKKPQSDTVKLAAENQIPLLSTTLSMYECCGRLFKRGCAHITT